MIKKLIIGLLFTQAIYAYDIPRTAFEVGKLEEARQESADDKKPLIFLISPKALKES